MNAYKFEIERLDKKIGEVKGYYFDFKDKQLQKEQEIAMGQGEMNPMGGDQFMGDFGGMDPNQMQAMQGYDQTG